MKGSISLPSRKALAILHIVVFVLVILLNTLAVLLPLNGKTTGALSDQYPNLFTPASLTFSIWGLIYLLLLAFTVYQTVVLFKVNDPSAGKVISISGPFIINCLANACWIIAWHYEQVLLSVCIMFVILLSLIVIHERLRLSHSLKPVSEKLFLDLPFSVYLGWISIATIANIAALLVNLNWKGAGISSYGWMMVVICIGVVLNIYMVLFKNNVAFGLVGIWAFIGIILKRKTAGGENAYDIIFLTQIGVSLIVVAVVLEGLKCWKKSVSNVLSTTG